MKIGKNMNQKKKKKDIYEKNKLEIIENISKHIFRNDSIWYAIKLSSKNTN